MAATKTTGLTMAGSINGVTLDQIKTEYHRTKLRPTTLAQVADMFSLDYIDLCVFLREHFESLNMHIMSGAEGRATQTTNADYVCDYYLVSQYSLEMIAIIFDYHSKTSVRECLDKCQTYRERVKFNYRRHRAARVKMAEFWLQEAAPIAHVQVTVPQLNRALVGLINNRIVPTQWKKNGGSREIAIYAPIYERLKTYAKAHNATLNDTINSALFRVILGDVRIGRG